MLNISGEFSRGGGVTVTTQEKIAEYTLRDFRVVDIRNDMTTGEQTTLMMVTLVRPIPEDQKPTSLTAPNEGEQTDAP